MHLLIQHVLRIVFLFVFPFLNYIHLFLVVCLVLIVNFIFIHILISLHHYCIQLLIILVIQLFVFLFSFLLYSHLFLLPLVETFNVIIDIIKQIFSLFEICSFHTYHFLCYLFFQLHEVVILIQVIVEIPWIQHIIF